MMVRGFLSTRIGKGNRLHHLWRNNGTWWCHYTLHFGNRKRRIRKSLGTSDLQVAIDRRDALFARITAEGEEVPERRPRCTRIDRADRLLAFGNALESSHAIRAGIFAMVEATED